MSKNNHFRNEVLQKFKSKRSVVGADAGFVVVREGVAAAKSPNGSAIIG
jgi:hypothetical protein